MNISFVLVQLYSVGYDIFLDCDFETLFEVVTRFLKLVIEPHY
jgi:hypothetical protein